MSLSRMIAIVALASVSTYCRPVQNTSTLTQDAAVQVSCAESGRKLPEASLRVLKAQAGKGLLPFEAYVRVPLPRGWAGANFHFLTRDGRVLSSAPSWSDAKQTDEALDCFEAGLAELKLPKIGKEELIQRMAARDTALAKKPLPAHANGNWFDLPAVLASQGPRLGIYSPLTPTRIANDAEITVQIKRVKRGSFKNGTFDAGPRFYLQAVGVSGGQNPYSVVTGSTGNYGHVLGESKTVDFGSSESADAVRIGGVEHSVKITGKSINELYQNGKASSLIVYAREYDHISPDNYLEYTQVYSDAGHENAAHTFAGMTEVRKPSLVMEKDGTQIEIEVTFRHKSQ